DGGGKRLHFHCVPKEVNGDMHVKSMLISAAVIISGATLLGSVPAQAQDRPMKEGERLHQLCEGGDRRACVRFGMMLNENRGRHDEWRRSHPQFWSFQATSDKSGGGRGGTKLPWCGVPPNHSAMRSGYAAPGRGLRTEGLTYRPTFGRSTGTCAEPLARDDK